MNVPEKRYQTFQQFYPFYLEQHSNPYCRLLHLVGTTGVLTLFLLALVSRNLKWLLLAPVIGYGFAWIGHFFFEKNRPATFEYPLYSLIGDFKMYWQFCCGKLRVFK